MKSKDNKIKPRPMYAGENEYEAWRRAYYQHHGKQLSYHDERFQTQCARAYLRYLMTNGL